MIQRLFSMAAVLLDRGNALRIAAVVI